VSRARAVIGASFGDCGKGVVTDYLCTTQGAGVVVRFSGGANAGHTVVRPDGKRHVFKHFGSGTLAGVPTFLSQFFVCNPILFFEEGKLLGELGVPANVFVHPDCLITTFADMIINQQLEIDRGADRHGSVGVGVNETIMRSGLPELKITMADIWNRAPIEDLLREICGKYAQWRCGRTVDNADEMIAAFVHRCELFAEAVHPGGIADCRNLDPVFEGSQGLLLDQNNEAFFPHLTRSNTGMQNVRTLCAQAGIDDIDAYYVSRTYLTRHGAGPLPGEDPKMSYFDDTNSEHDFQGKIRFARLDHAALRQRCTKDYGSDDYNLVLTHCDQEPPPCEADLYFYGPSYTHASHKPRAP
jgi:adenylosuccinate synthase